MQNALTVRNEDAFLVAAPSTTGITISQQTLQRLLDFQTAHPDIDLSESVNVALIRCVEEVEMERK